MKIFFITLMISFVLTLAHGQTNVGGLISANTTWTLVGSPYIVISNTLVDSGVTLTIQPGVEVKFNSGLYLYIDGALDAQGTSSSYITFTSQSQTVGSYIELKFRPSSKNSTNTIKYCIIEYAQNGITVDGSSPMITNSIIRYNEKGINCLFSDGTPVITDNIIFSNSVSGIYGYTLNGFDIFRNTITYNGNGIDMPITSKKINFNTIKHNTNGIWWDSGGGNSTNEIIGNEIDSNSSYGVYFAAYSLNVGIFKNNSISNNNIGLFLSRVNGTFLQNNISDNQTGIKIAPYLTVHSLAIHNNCIVNNTIYNFNNGNINDIDPTNNWWGTSDSLIISSSIYDFYEDFNLGKVIFSPLLTGPDSSCGLTSSIFEISILKEEKIISVYPNPFSSLTTIQANVPLNNTTLTIVNSFGQTVTQIKNINEQTITLHSDNLPCGLYFVRLSEDNQVFATKKLIITD